MPKMIIDQSNEYLLIGLVFSSLLLSYLFTYFIQKYAIKLHLIDVPNQRSSHTEPTPRGGGMAIVLTFVILIFVARTYLGINSNQFWGLFINSVLVAVLGFLDDLFTLRRSTRLIGWVVITIISLSIGINLSRISIPFLGLIHFGFLSPLVTFIWLIGVTNIFNFMDGINGLASWEALIVSGFLAGIAIWSGNLLVIIVSIIVFGAVLGFLPYNFPRAKIFMGDGGSNFLGYIFASLAVIGSQNDIGYIPFLIPVILLNLFLFDAGTTLIRRLPQGKKWLDPHRDHYYQRLIKQGYSHKRVTLLYSGLNIILGVLAIIFLRSADYIAFAIILVSIIPFLIVVLITKRQEKYQVG